MGFRLFLHGFHLLFVGLILLASPRLAWSVSNYVPEDFSLLTSDMARTLVKTVGIGADHRAFAPATPLGTALGIELGLAVSAVQVPPDFRSAIVLTSGVAADAVPSLLPVPALLIRKGLPWGFDVGFSFSRLVVGGAVAYKSVGGDLQWAFLRGGKTMNAPAMALRATYASEQLFFIQSRQISFDLVASKNFLVVDPYIGAGVQLWSGELVVPAGVPTGGAALKQSGSTPRLFVGLPLKLLILKFTAQADYSLEKVLTYGGKITLSF